MRLGKIKLILGIFIPFLSFFLMSQNTFAYVQTVYLQDGGNFYEVNTGEVSGLSTATTAGQLSSAIYSSSTKFTSGSNWILYPNWYAGMGNVSGNYLSVNADYYYGISATNMSSYINTSRNIMTENNLRCVAGDNINNYDGTYAPQITGYNITYEGPYSTGSSSPNLYRIHVQYHYVQQLSSTKNGGNVKCGWARNPSNGLLFQAINSTTYAPFTFAYQNNGTTARLYSDYNQALLEQQINNQTTIINNNQEYYDANYQAVDNIENQNYGDISDAENSQTTNLISILQSFFTEISRFSATSCELTLPFPNFLNGSQTVNICQGKDVLGNFITVISSLALIAFYIPLAIVMIKMIYNEIRSWTNG